MTDSVPDPAVPEMRDLVCGIAQSLVDAPASVRVESDGTGSESVLRVLVRDEDLERLQGRSGRTARSLRTIVMAAGQKLGSRVVLDIDVLE